MGDKKSKKTDVGKFLDEKSSSGRILKPSLKKQAGTKIEESGSKASSKQTTPAKSIKKKERSIPSENIISFLEKYGKISNLELEARFKISPEAYNRLNNFILNANKLKYTSNTPTYSNDIIEIAHYKGPERVSYRKIKQKKPKGEEEEDVIQKKIEKDKIWDTEWGYNVALSSETVLIEGDEDLSEIDQKYLDDFVPIIKRERRRVSIKFLDIDTSPYYNLIFDLSSIIETQFKENKQNIIQYYEFEIEKGKIKKESTNSFINAIQTSLCLIQNVKEISQLTPYPIIQDSINTFNNILYTQKYSSEYPILHTQFAAQPINISLDTFLTPNIKYWITPKLNGLRQFLLVTNQGLFICERANGVYLIGTVKNFKGNCLYDGEYFVNKSSKDEIQEFHIFDCIIYNGKDQRQFSFSNRFNKVDVDDFLPRKGYSILKKKFVFEENIYENAEKCWNSLKKNNNEVNSDIYDGLIYQGDIPYFNKGAIKKWKPPNQLTIDFYVDEDLYLYTYHEQFNQFYITEDENETSDNRAKLSSKQPDAYKNFIGFVVECYWDYENKQFIPIKIRYDKTYPNNTSVAKEIWKNILKPVTFETITGKDFSILRRFLNRDVKTELIRENTYEDCSILDGGSGRGGDIKKWIEAKLNKIYVIDPSFVDDPEKSNLTEFNNRLNYFKREYTKIPEILIVTQKNGKSVGIENTKAIKTFIKKNEINVISLFFCLTYLAENNEKFDGVIETLSSILDREGTVIGIVLDGLETEKILNKGNIDNSAFSIKLDTKKIKSGKTGNQITINIKEESAIVHDQIEWLFYFDLFEKKLKQNGFTLKSYLLDENSKYKELFNLLPKLSQDFCKLNRAFIISKGTPKKLLEEEIEKEKPDIRIIGKIPVEVEKLDLETPISKRKKKIIVEEEEVEEEIEEEKEEVEEEKKEEVEEEEEEKKEEEEEEEAFKELEIQQVFGITAIDQKKKYNNDYGISLQYIGIEKDKSNFIRCFLYATDENYASPSVADKKEQRSELVKYVRETLAKSLTMEMFKDLNRGTIYETIVRNIKKETSKLKNRRFITTEGKLITPLEIENLALKQYQNELLTSYLEQSSVSDYLMKYYKYNIFVLDNLSQPTTFFRDYCDNMEYDKSIILTTSDAQAFYVVCDSKGKTLFSSNSDLIKKIKAKLCR